MSDAERPFIFVSQSSDDDDIVERLVEQLRAEDLEVRWDRDLDPGRSYDEQFDEWIRDAASVLAVWSDTAKDKPWVIAQASAARTLGKYIPITIAGMDAIPATFARDQTHRMSDWVQDPNHPQFDRLVEILRKATRAAAARSATEPRRGPSDPQFRTPFQQRNMQVPPWLVVLTDRGDLVGLGVVIDPGWVATVPSLQSAATGQFADGSERPLQVEALGSAALLRFPRATSEPSVVRLAPPALGESCEFIIGADDQLVRWVGVISSVSTDGSITVTGSFPDSAWLPLGSPVLLDDTVVGLVTDNQQGNIIRAVGIGAIQNLRTEIGTRPGDAIVDRLLDQAETMAEGRVPLAEHVLLAALGWGDRTGSNSSAGALASFIGPQVEARINAAASVLSGSRFAEQDRPGGPDWPLQLANDLAAHVGGGPLSVRHLIAASLLASRLDPEVLDLLGVTQSDLRSELARAAGSAHLDEAPAWRSLLSGDDLWTFPPDGPAADAHTEMIGGYDPDEVVWDSAEDQLEVSTYVKMIAEIMASKTTKVPLSIGVFGEWGSGKSYFMALLKRRLDVLAARSRVSNESAEAPYHSAIEHIRFNAWHYADANLWASLAARVFDHLNKVINPPTDVKAIRRLELGIVTERRDLLKQQRNTSQAEVDELKRQVAAARTEQVDQQTQIQAAAGRALQAAAATEAGQAVLADARAAAEVLGLPTGLSGDPAKLRDEVERTQILWRRAFELARRLNTWAVVTWITAFAVALLAFSRLEELLAAATTALVPLVSFVRAAWPSVKRAREAAEQAVAELEPIAYGQLAERQTRLTVAIEEQHRLEGLLDEAERSVKQAQKELDELGTPEQLARFVAERSLSSDYRGQLGVVSLVRSNFEQLVELLQPDPDDPSAPAHVDRIVLYIDDLDRCPPSRVVEVLEAVHLLLALELFVVVVGVDPRWLTESLTLHHRAFGTAEGSARPLDYLEKIFQIPFVLPPMTSEGLGTMVEALVPIEPALPSQQEVGGPAATRSAAIETVQPTKQPPPLSIEPESVLDPETSTPPLGLTEPELEFLALLAPIVETPRAAKRLLNVYRMFRATQSLRAASDFLSRDGRAGDHVVVAELLAIASAEPLVFQALCGTSRSDMVEHLSITGRRDWPAVVEGLITTGVAPDPGESDPELFAALRRLAPRLADEDLLGARARAPRLERYRYWAPYVARFSFDLGVR